MFAQCTGTSFSEILFALLYMCETKEGFASDLKKVVVYCVYVHKLGYLFRVEWFCMCNRPVFHALEVAGGMEMS